MLTWLPPPSVAAVDVFVAWLVACEVTAFVDDGTLCLGAATDAGRESLSFLRPAAREMRLRCLLALLPASDSEWLLDCAEPMVGERDEGRRGQRLAYMRPT